MQLPACVLISVTSVKHAPLSQYLRLLWVLDQNFWWLPCCYCRYHGPGRLKYTVERLSRDFDSK